jgi:hypothetical protein
MFVDVKSIRIWLSSCYCIDLPTEAIKISIKRRKKELDEKRPLVGIKTTSKES